MAVLGLFAGRSRVLLIHRRRGVLPSLWPPHWVHRRDRRGITLVMGEYGLDMAKACYDNWLGIIVELYKLLAGMRRLGLRGETGAAACLLGSSGHASAAVG